MFEVFRKHSCETLRSISLLVLVAAACTRLAVADEGCVAVSFRPRAERLEWSAQVFDLPAPDAVPVLAADIDGDGSEEIVLRMGDKSLASYAVRDGAAPKLQVLGIPPVGTDGAPLWRLRRGDEPSDLLVWYRPAQLTGRSYSKDSSGRVRAVDWLAMTPLGVFAPPPLLNWRCSARAAASVMITEWEKSNPATSTFICGEYGNFGMIDYHSAYSIRRIDRASATGDLDGDGIEELLVTTPDTFAWFHAPLNAEYRPWAYFPTQGRWTRSFVADFDGDGRADIFTTGDPFHNSMIAFSYGQYAVERATAWPLGRNVQVEDLLFGDLNGDGWTDLAALDRTSSPPTLRVAMAVPPPPTPVDGTLLILEGSEALFTVPFPLWPAALSHLETGHLDSTRSICKLATGRRRLIFVPFAATPELRTVLTFPGTKRAWSIPTSRAADDPRITGAPADFSQPPNHPTVCIGYVPSPFVDPGAKWGMTVNVCAPGYGYFGAAEGTSRDRRKNYVAGSCCPLPSDDILAGETSRTEFRCPDNSIVVGSIPAIDCGTCTTELICRTINTGRYRLGPARPGRYWGSGFSGRWQEDRLQPSDIPVAIRFGITRDGYSTWATDGCVGYPIGSLLVEIGGKACDQSFYRELLYRGNPGDPPDGTPVQMFPSCREIVDAYNPTTGCFSTAGQ